MKKRRFSKEDWISLGLNQLSAHGPEAVKLEAICKAAQLTRGSFYHHFGDHQGFLIGLAQHWRETQTTDVAAAVDPDAPPSAQSAALTAAAMEIDYRLELGMRELGRRIPAINQIVTEADAVRRDVLRRIYQARYGIDTEMAAALAHLEYAAFCGLILLEPDLAADRQRYLAGLYDRTMGRALQQEDAP